MSRPRSRSPRYRRFPWEEPDFDPYRVLAELDGDPMDRSHRHREVPSEHYFRDYFREDMYPEGQRRASHFPEDHHFRAQHTLDREEFCYRRPTPHRDGMAYEDRGLSLLSDDEGDGERHRGGYRGQLQSFENRGRSPYSPQRLDRERSLLASQYHSEHQQREPGMGWRREEQDRGRGRFRDLSPSARSDDKRGGAGREREERRNAQGLNRERRREESHQERNPPLKRQRRELDDADHLGYRNEENFGDQRYSLDTLRVGFGGDHQGSLPHTRNLGPLIIEHDHGITDSRVLPRWEQFQERRGLDPDFDHQQSPRPMGSSQERFRTSENRLDDREEARRYHIQDNLRDANYPETRRSPVQQDRQNPMRYGNRDGPTNHKGRSGARSAKGRLDNGQGGRTGPPRNQAHLKQTSQAYQDPIREEQRTGYRPFREDRLEGAIEQNRSWAEEQRLQQWEHDRAESLDRHPPRNNLDPKMPRQREREWNDQKKNMTVVTEETLTVKVDMSRPVNQNSLLCYSSDRQLSLDLVNVGRQRLDFLPMLEHSGTYRETAMHTGTFAQEIITLVHQVKDQYFRDNGVTLNERFSAPQKGGYSEEETEELTLDERFSSNRGFSVNMNSLLDDDVPLFSRLGPLQDLDELPEPAPGDLRHSLERRRQKRLEGVKVTIQGNSISLGQISELEYSDKDDGAQREDGGFSNFTQEQSRRREGNMGQRRSAPSRPNSGPQRRNNRNGKMGGQMRRQNNRNNHTGQNW